MMLPLRVLLPVALALPGLALGQAKTSTNNGSTDTTASNPNAGKSPQEVNPFYWKDNKPSADGLPKTTQPGQTGTNKCGTKSSQDSMCQNLYVNNIRDFCLWAPPTLMNVSNAEADVVAYCTRSGRGTRVMPFGTITGATFVETPSYWQISGTGDFTKTNVPDGDPGGELDFSGAELLGNPRGNLVFHCEKGQCVQTHRWTNFMADKEFCIRVCKDGQKSESMCRNEYDTFGCEWNMPMPAGVYDKPGTFQTCESDDAEDVAFHDGKYFPPGQDPDTSPGPHDAPALRNCKASTEKDLYGAVSGDVFGNGKKPTYEDYTGNTNMTTGSGGDQGQTGITSGNYTTDGTRTGGSGTGTGTTMTNTTGTTNTTGDATDNAGNTTAGSTTGTTSTGTTTSSAAAPSAGLAASLVDHATAATLLGLIGIFAGSLLI